MDKIVNALNNRVLIAIIIGLILLGMIRRFATKVS
jgi:hypothetical protein